MLITILEKCNMAILIWTMSVQFRTAASGQILLFMSITALLQVGLTVDQRSAKPKLPRLILGFYFIPALRQLGSNHLYLGLNIGGFAVGLASAPTSACIPSPTVSQPMIP